MWHRVHCPYKLIPLQQIISALNPLCGQLLASLRNFFVKCVLCVHTADLSRKRELKEIKPNKSQGGFKRSGTPNPHFKAIIMAIVSRGQEKEAQPLQCFHIITLYIFAVSPLS